MPRVLGYAEPLTVAPGEEIRFMVGTSTAPAAIAPRSSGWWRVIPRPGQ